MGRRTGEGNRGHFLALICNFKKIKNVEWKLSLGSLLLPAAPQISDVPSEWGHSSQHFSSPRFSWPSFHALYLGCLCGWVLSFIRL